MRRASRAKKAKGAEPAAPEPELRRRILDAAGAVLLGRGYAGAKTLEIATRAKVSKRELYALFGSKRGILRALIEDRAGRLRQPLRLPEPTDQASLIAMLRSFGAEALRQLSHRAVVAMYRLAVTETETSPEVAQALESARRGTRDALCGLLSRAQSRGLLEGDGDADMMTRHFFALLWGDSQLSLIMGTVAPPNDTECAARAEQATATWLMLYPPRDASIAATGS
jgi:AcrR family transcriptional regulator